MSTAKSNQEMKRPFTLIAQFARDFLRLYTGSCITVGLLMIASVLLQLPIPILTMYIIDHTVSTKNLNLLTQVTLLLAALVVTKHLFSYFNETLTLGLKENIILEIQRRLINTIQGLPLSFFSDKHSSYLQTRVMNDSRAIEGALVRTLVSIAVDGLTFLVGFVLIMFIRYELALLLFVFLIPFAYIRYYANEKMRILSRDMQEASAVSSAVMSESFAGNRTIKAYLREDFQSGIIDERLKGLRDIYIKTNWFGVVSTVGTSFLTAMSVTFVLWYGARSVMSGHMTLGQIFAILAFLSFLYGPINSFVAANLRIQQSAAAIQRIYEFLKQPGERKDGTKLEQISGKIEFRDVSFAYDGVHNVLEGVSFSINPGTAVALVGRTGAGKSSLVNLLLGFYSAQGGEVLLDGHNIDKLSLETVRRSIGVVDQQTFLFSGTIQENIRFGKPDATLEEIIAASKQSYADEFIERLPEGYQTLVGERGVRLSGGQCQRIALARMFLKNPQILILDEAVSAIDSESERYIQRALVPLVSSRTTIVIAHRLSSLMLADYVIVIDQGKVVEKGLHHELMAADGAYANLFHEQFHTQLKRSDTEESTVAVA
ncbi:MAG TPA: ABC transporter ATP-binding protein [Pyrinomonadaceae bacterium]|jgi:ABC-type multidrug transport system fused ATPase/permease subunit|nr:ABC transporter ATP-binding protein [Pyrinomonadaceae bacterium]